MQTMRKYDYQTFKHIRRLTASTLMMAVLLIIATVLLYTLYIEATETGEHTDKIWLHRCNSIEKLQEKHEDYPNIEVDVIFFRQDSTFDVTHDPENSIDLDLNDYFAYLKEHGGKIWLDIKNLTRYNKEALCSSLTRLLRQFQIEKDRLIVESPNWKSLKYLTDEGYYTSCYVTYEKPRLLENEEMDRCIERLQRIVDKNAVRALSFPGYWYGPIKEELNRPIDLLTWEHRKTQLQLLLSPKGQIMLSDPQLKVILVKDKGDYHR